MLDCLMLGDSLAVGVAQARPSCAVVARVGIGSGAFLQSMFPTAAKSASHVVISLGVNDDASVDTLANLRQLRRGVAAGRVTWLLPGLKETVRHHIRTVAAENRDRVVDTISQVGPDKLHPGRDGYRLIASWTEQGGAPATTFAPTLAATTGAPGLAMGPLRRYVGNPVLIPMPGAVNGLQGQLPRIQMPGSIYGSWPVSGLPYASIPPRTYAFRAIPPVRTAY